MINLTQKPFYLTEEQSAEVIQLANRLTDEEKVGQLFCLLGSIYSDDELNRLVSDYHVSGFLFRPMPADDLQKKWARLDQLTQIPLLKAANLEEGGYGANEEGTYFANPLQVAATNDLEITRKFAKVCAVEGKAAGCNWNFAPVSDIDFNTQNPITNVRTYGSDVQTVVDNVKCYVQTLQQNGMAAACKHFPGDGVDYRDQHLHPTYNSLSAADWYASYGRVYSEAIDVGLLSVMVGHIVQPALEKEINAKLEIADMLPASQSKQLLSGVLRGKLGFNGLIITDATIMGGYCMSLPRKAALTASINAGCDIFCFSTDFYEDYGYLLEALHDGTLSRERLDEAVIRILALKMTLESMSYPQETIESIAWRNECADKSITLVKDIQHLIPFDRERFPQIEITVVGEDEIAEGYKISLLAENYFKSQGFEVSHYHPLEDDLHGTSQLSKDKLRLILVNCPTASNQTTVRINWSPKHALDMPRFVDEETYAMISFNNPYHLQDAPRVRTYINAYSPTKASVLASFDKMLGYSPFVGVSPVDAFCGLVDTHL